MTGERYYFDVFGVTMRVERSGGEWMLHRVSVDGKSSPVRELRIPSELSADELATFLDDMYHEFATPQHSVVTRKCLGG